MRLAPFLLLAACTQQAGFQKPSEGDSGDTDADADTDTDADADTDDTDGDLDGDGYTPEEGDCDDADVRISPARPEEPEDTRDNDCDGKIDEAFTGVDVAYMNEAGRSSILTIDTIGRLDAEVDLDSGCVPFALDHHEDGWVLINGHAYVSVATADGGCEDVGDFTDPEVYEFGVYGVATGIDGTIYAAAVTQLASVAPDGTITELASWVTDFDVPENHELAGVALAVDPLTGTVGIFDYTGGFATWSAGEGLVIHKIGSATAPTLTTFAGAHRDGGGWYTPGLDPATGAYGIYVFDIGTSEWVLQDAWTDEDWVPEMLAIDGETGDAYVTANAGWFYTVWRIVPESNTALNLYVTDGTVQDRLFQGIVIND